MNFQKLKWPAATFGVVLLGASLTGLSKKLPRETPQAPTPAHEDKAVKLEHLAEEWLDLEMKAIEEDIARLKEQYPQLKPDESDD